MHHLISPTVNAGSIGNLAIRPWFAIPSCMSYTSQVIFDATAASVPENSGGNRHYGNEDVPAPLRNDQRR